MDRYVLTMTDRPPTDQRPDDEPILASSVPVRPAATVMLVRDSDHGLEVFMLQRSHQSAFARSQYVFPGGRVDDADDADAYERIADGVTDASASARLGVERGGLAWLIAAIRECFEEAGVLLARPTATSEVVDTDDPATAHTYEAARHRIHDGNLTLVDFCAEQDLQLLTDRIHLVDHWITPVGERRRFDTRFFVAAAPPTQTPLHDNAETIASLWVEPSEALARFEAGELGMFPPTVVSLQWLAQYPTAESAVAAASQSPIPRPFLPKLVLDDDGKMTGIIGPDDPGYDAAEVPMYCLERL